MSLMANALSNVGLICDWKHMMLYTSDKVLIYF